MKWLASILRRIANWLDPIEVIDSSLITHARELTTSQESTLHTGSYKRAMVMKELMRVYPKTSRKDLSLAIELALR